MSAELDMFGAVTLPGLLASEAFLGAAEEGDPIERIDAEDLAPFRFQQWTGKRLTRSLGWSYDLRPDASHRLIRFPPGLLPTEARAAERADLPADQLAQALLIRYDAGAEMGRHKDRPQFDDVVGISLGKAAQMRFRRHRQCASSVRPHRSPEVRPAPFRARFAQLGSTAFPRCKCLVGRSVFAARARG